MKLYESETFLTDDEIRQLTGYQQANKQTKALDAAGIYYVLRGDGRPQLTWHHVNHPYGLPS